MRDNPTNSPGNESSGTITAWLKVAARPTVVRRGLLYAVVVGAILITINHGDAILRGDLTPPRLFKMILTALVPYCVSTLSSVGAIRRMKRERNEGGSPRGDM